MHVALDRRTSLVQNKNTLVVSIATTWFGWGESVTECIVVCVSADIKKNYDFICKVTDGISHLSQLFHLFEPNVLNDRETARQQVLERRGKTSIWTPLTLYVLLFRPQFYSLVSGRGAWGEITTSYVTGLLMSPSKHSEKWSEEKRGKIRAVLHYILFYKGV